MPNKLAGFRAHMRSAVLVSAAAVALTGILAARSNAQIAGGGVPAPPMAAPAPPPAAPGKAAPLGVNDPRNPLHLDADQQRKWIAIQTKYEPQVQAILQNKSLTQAQKQTQITSLFKKGRAELMSILTPSQRVASAKMSKLAAARQAKIAQIQQIVMQVEKSFTPDQKKKLAAIQAQLKPQVDQLQKDKSLSAGQKQAKMMALGKAYVQERDKILTPQQKAMMQKIQDLQKSAMGTGSVQ